MTHWSKEKIEEIRSSNLAREKAFDNHRYEKDQCRFVAAEVFRRLLETVIEDVSAVNDLMDDNEQKLSAPECIGEAKFQVRRAYSPEFTLDVELKTEIPSIAYTIMRPSRRDGKPYLDSGYFGFHLQNTGDVTLTKHRFPITLQDASREMISPAIEGYRR